LLQQVFTSQEVKEDSQMTVTKSVEIAAVYVTGLTAVLQPNETEREYCCN
jgi:hypothetical protein